MNYGGSTDNYKNLFSEHSKTHTNTNSTLRDLEARLNKLELVTEAMWKVLQKETNLKEVDLIEQIAAIDLQDGTYDGKKRKTSAFKCTRCGRMNSKRHTKCIYCSEVFLSEPFD